MEQEYKYCENCEEVLNGEYCHKCGQKDIDTNFSFLGLFGFLFREYINWDNKVLRTFKALFFKPGYLSKQYIEGKRSTYMNPLRLYFFTSFFYFTLVFATNSSGPEKEVSKTTGDSLTKTEQLKLDSIQIAKANELKLDSTKKANTMAIKDSTKKEKGSSFYVEFNDKRQGIFLTDNDIDKMEESFLKRILLKFDTYPDNYVNNKILAYLPKFLFFVLPIIGLLFNLFFVRRKQFKFYNHFVYISHNHSFLFSLLFLVTLFSLITEKYDDYTGKGALLYFSVYIPISLKVCYQQSWAKTLLKCFLITLGYAIITIISLIFLLILIYLLN